MKMFSLKAILGPIAILLLSTPLGYSAPLPWSKSYTIDTGVPGSTLFGTVYAHPTSGAGLVLLGASQESASGESRLLPSLARFNDAGDLLWKVWLDGGPGSSDPRLGGPSDSTRVLAAYTTATDTYRVGSYRGGNRTKVFAFEVAVFEPDFDGVILDEGARFFDNGNLGLVELGDGAVKVTVLNADGTKKIDKTYAAEAFGVDPAVLIPPTGALALEPLGDGSGYVLTVSISVPTFVPVPPFSFSYDTTISLLCLDNAGGLRWAKTVVMNDTGGEVSATSWPGPSGQIVVALSETTARVGLSENAHLLRFAANGALTWARTIPDTAPNFIRTEGGDLWYFALSGDRSDVKVLRLNETSGSVIAQATLDTGALDEGVGVGFIGGRMFFRMQSAPGLSANEPRQAYVLSLDSLLQNPVVRKYKKPVANLTMSPHPASGGFIFSPHDAAGVVEIVSLNTALQPVTDCDLFTNATISVVNAGISATPASITAANLSVTVANAATVLSPTDITLRSLNLNEASLCGNSGVPTAPRLAIHPAAGGDFEIRFSSESGVSYEVRMSPVVAGPFDTLAATLSGTGSELIYRFGAPASGAGYYVVRAIRR